MPSRSSFFRNAIPLLAFAAILSGTCSYAAENDKVVSITISDKNGKPVPDESFVRSHISSAVGGEVNSKTVSDDVRLLLDSGHYSYVGTRVDNVPGGINLSYILELRKRVAGRIDFEGLDYFGYSKAMETIALKSGDFVDEDSIGAATERLRRKYEERRFYGAKIKGVMTPLPQNPGAVRLTIKVDEGRRTKVNMIEVDGNKSIKARHLRKASGQSPWWNPAGWFSTKRVSDFDLDVLKSDMRRQYLAKGYLDVAIDGPSKTLNEDELDIKFKVDEGILYKVGKIEFEGVTLFPESALLAAMPLKPGHIAGTTAISNSERALREYFTAQGYVDTKVMTSTYPEQGQRGIINVVYTVKESEIAKVGGILIRGNTYTKDKVIRREISLNPGDIYDGVQAERSRRRLQNLGYFSDVRMYDVVSDDENQFRDIIYEMDEKSTGSLMFGAGFSSIDHLVGMLEITQSNFDISNPRNFRGGGQKARLGLQASKDATDLEASIIEPWFLDRRLSLNVDGFIRNRSYREYDESRMGGSVGLTKHVPWIGRVGLSYTLQRVTLDDVMEDLFFLADDPDTEFRYTDEDDDYMLGSMRLAWTYDTRDNPMVPHSGTRATASATLYNEAFLSDHDFYQLDTQWRNYQSPWYEHVISFSVRAGVVDTYGSEDIVPIGSRYFLGGGRRVRGFKYRNIGPKAIPAENSESGFFRPVGGQTILEGTVEYSIPIVKYFRIAAFYDIGNVWADPYDFDLGEYASSAGGGIRLDIPGFPIRLDYAEALEKDDDLTRERSIVFWIGFDN